MDIRSDQTPNPSKLTMTMDKHPVGASWLLVAALLAGECSGYLDLDAFVMIETKQLLRE